VRRDSLFGAIRIASGAALFALCLALVARKLGLPSLSSVFSGLASLWSSGVLAHDIEVTTARWAIGWSGGAAVGIVLGLVTGRSRAVSLMLEGFLILLRAIPFIALLPLTLRIFGLTEVGKFFLVGWASASICWVVVHQSAREVSPILRWRAVTLGAPTYRWVSRVLLPACGAGIYTALRTSLALALLVVAVAEMGGVYQRSTGLWWSEGLGYRLFRSYDVARDDYLLGGIIVFALLGIALEQLFSSAWSLSAYLLFLMQQRRARRQTAALSTQLADASALNLPEPVPVILADLSAAYGSRAVVSGMSLKIDPGATLSIIGPSGCGKTTLLRAIGRLDGNELQIDGSVDVGGIGRSTPGVWMGVVFQDSPVFEYMTVWDNVMFGNSADETIAWRLLSDFGLTQLVAERARTLSGGQRQRLAVATALASRPQLLLLDEPFGALDAITRRQLQTFYRTHVRGRVTAVFVTHDVTEALLVGNVIAVGVGADRKLLAVDGAVSSSGEWEFSPRFSDLKREAFEELERLSTGSRDTQIANHHA